ncbi:MAG: hypothetical protein AAFV62_13410, partial [Pseudomonadota bacterium]
MGGIPQTRWNAWADRPLPCPCHRPAQPTVRPPNIASRPGGNIFTSGNTRFCGNIVTGGNT